VLASCSGGGGGTTKGATAPTGLAFHTGKPPWPLRTPQIDYIRAAGLPALAGEVTTVHFHAHLDVIADKEPVPVPVYIGIDLQNRLIAPMHTHTGSGIIHVEAAKDDALTLGQFLTEWGIKATKSCIAAYCESRGEVAVYVDGVRQDGPAIDLVIKGDTEIALVLGPGPVDVPAFYDCTLAGAEASTCQNFPRPGG
jgi:hypothetical protein